MRNSSTTLRPVHILPVIALSQWLGTSLWFAGNAILKELPGAIGLGADAIGLMTSSVQLGFILGTLVYAFLAISDRFSPRLVFLFCSLAGAGFNLGIWLFSESLTWVLLFRFLTGFFLAGIYPVGMKIASGWYREDLGKALGWLVGALVVGTALPHLINSALSWQAVLVAVSLAAATGGVLMWACVPDGPYLSGNTKFDPTAFRTIFSSARFRASAFGYFGHMWELYAFWAFVPLALNAVAETYGIAESNGLDLSLWSFLIIASGAVGCLAGGVASLRVGSAKVAAWQLSASGFCCVLSPFSFALPLPLFLAFLLFWGVVVVGDSPQFSTLNAHNAPAHLVGSALTLVNCIGFSITIASIQLLGALASAWPIQYIFLPLALGPLLGVVALRPLLKTS